MQDRLTLDQQLFHALNASPAREWIELPRLDTTEAIVAFRHKRRLMSEAKFSQIERAGVITEVETLSGLQGDAELSIRIHRPAADGQDLPCLYFIHGGGMIIGSARFDDARLIALVRQFGCIATSVEYRLAPETKAPGMAEDCYAGLVWLAENAARLCIDRSRIIVGGVSGGGGLAAITAIMARDHGMEILLQWLLYPQLDDRHITPSSLIDWPTWPNRTSVEAWKAILGDRYGTDKVTPYDAAARIEEMSGLAPVFLEVGDMEVFRDECIDYATRLIRAGVPTEFHLYPGCCHGFDGLAPETTIARQAVMTRNAALARAWRGG